MLVLVAHGASGRASSMQGHVEGLAARGVSARAIDLPLRRAERAVPAYLEIARSILPAEGPPILSGQSYGGRVASLLAAAQPAVGAGLICFSYPLHRPGAPDWEERSRHWPGITLPVLLLSGEADPFARLELLRRAVDERLPHARLVTFGRIGHSLRPALDEVLDVAAGFVREVERTGAASG